MSRRSIWAIIVAFALALLVPYNSASADEPPVTASDMTGAVLSVDPGSVADRQVEVTYMNNHTTRAFYLAPRVTDSAGLVTDLVRTLVGPQNGTPSRDYPVSDFAGVGPWTFELRFTGDNVEYFTMDTATVSVSDVPTEEPTAVEKARAALAAAQAVLTEARAALAAADTRAEKATARKVVQDASRAVREAKRDLRVALRAAR